MRAGWRGGLVPGGDVEVDVVLFGFAGADQRVGGLGIGHPVAMVDQSPRVIAIRAERPLPSRKSSASRGLVRIAG